MEKVQGSLKSLVDDKVFAKPPRVEYFFTEYEESLFPVIDAMSSWGLVQMGANAE